MTLRSIILLIAALGALSAAYAQTYQVGDIVEDFELPNRLNGGASKLSDYAGHVILVEWFAYWCPFCNAAARDLDPGIIAHYEDLGGTAAGVPFLRIGMNLQADRRETDTQGTDGFISAHKIDPVLEDTSRLVARRFAPGGGQPIFAVINGIAGSPTHEQWEIISIVTDYSRRSNPIQDFRNDIDGVQAPVGEPSDTAMVVSPALTAAGSIRFRVNGNNREEIQIHRSKNLITWTALDTNIPSSDQEFIEIPLNVLEGDYYIQAIRTP